MAKNVLFIQRRMPEYRMLLFEELLKRLKEEGIKLTVVYGTPTKKEIIRGDEGILPWGIIIPCRYLNINSIQLVYQRIPRPLLQKQDLIIIPHENSLLFNYSLLLRRRSNNFRLAFFGHGANFQIEHSKCFRNVLKVVTSRYADWWFAYTKISVDKITGNRFPEEKITCVNNALDTSQLIEWVRSITPDEIYALRTSLGVKGDTVGIFIGSLYKDKRLDFLFSAVNELKKRLPEFELLIIGDGPLRDKVKKYAIDRPWVYWVGAKHGREKVLHMSLGKIMLNPGLVGLGILDSFALGIPMVTTDCKIHSPEIAYLESGRNGIMTSDNVESYLDSVVRLLKDDQLRSKIASACLEDSHHYSLEKMVDNFCEGILKALNSPLKPTPTRC